MTDLDVVRDASAAATAPQDPSFGPMNTANAALGISLGALSGTILGTAVFPGAALVIAPIVGATLGGVAGNFWTRLIHR
jgi:uncharacterized protein YcfJ